jgi:predicted Zn-dependent protease
LRMGLKLRILIVWMALAALPATAEVRLKTRILRGPGDLHAGILHRKTVGRSHLLAELDAPPGAAVLAEWMRRGIRVAGRVPPFAVVLSVPDGADLRAPGLRWAARLSGAEKVSALVGADEEAPGAYLVEFYPDVDMALARELVVEMGLQLLDHPDLMPKQLLALGSTDQVSRLAAWDEVAYIFPASADLLTGTHVLACAGAVADGEAVGQYVKVSEGWSTGPSGVELSYVFGTLIPKLPASTIQTQVVRAFEEWAKYAPLLFSPGTSTNAPRTIAVLFASGQHGDGYGFDGPGGVLAHTFYPAPPNSEPLAGDMHFDADEPWDSTGRIDLYSVALHESGHALGLGHSDKPGAVMYPYYRLNAQLANDDIAGLRAIYAAPDPEAPKPAVLDLRVTNPNAASVTVTTAAMSIAGTVSGGSGAVQLSWNTNQGLSGALPASSFWSIPAVALNLGLNIITVTASDGAGNVASKVIAVTRQPAPSNPSPPPGGPSPTPPAPNPTPSGGPPALKITSPGFTIVSTSAASITICGTASNGVTSVTWSNSTDKSGTATGTVTWSATVPLLTGTNNIAVRAFNNAGSAWRSLTVVRRP